MKITVIGCGIDSRKDLTLGALSAMREARAVLVLAKDYTRQVLAENGINSEPLAQLYQNGAADSENYDRIFAHVLTRAKEEQDIALVVPGHPVLGVTLVGMLKKGASQHGYQLEILPGLSSFDWMVRDQQRDPIERGTQLLDVNRLLLLDLAIEPCMDVYLYHICSVGTARTWIDDPARDNQISLLKAKLLRHFPQSAPCQLLSTHAGASSDTGILASATVGELESLLHQVTFASTLFIPALRPKSLNREFLALLQASEN